jgi:hypothetical protein
LLRLRIAEKQRELVPRGGFRCGHRGHCRGRSLAVRRKIDAVVYEIRKEMAKVALEMADKTGEPPLEQQAADRGGFSPLA